MLAGLLMYNSLSANHHAESLNPVAHVYRKTAACAYLLVVHRISISAFHKANAEWLCQKTLSCIYMHTQAGV